MICLIRPLLGLFQHTAARRRLRSYSFNWQGKILVSTHSRPKAAAYWQPEFSVLTQAVSTHSRPKAAASARMFTSFNAGFNTQPPEGGCRLNTEGINKYITFQHTAARRRLQLVKRTRLPSEAVSTHSRPKAAALSQ